MAMKGKKNPVVNKYVKIGIIAAAVIVVAGLGMWGISAMNRGASIKDSVKDVSSDVVTASEIRVAVIRMDAVQSEAKVLADLRKQKESMESKLRDELTKEQKSLEKEKAEIEKSQDVLSRDALAHRVSEYQQRVNKLQRSVAERAQAIEVAFQNTLAKIQKDDLDPIIAAIIEKKNLTMVIDGRFARMSDEADKNLDITDDVVKALDKRISNVKMEKPAK